MERGVSHVQGEARRAETGVAEQQWNTAQVDTGFEPMRRKGVPQ